MTVSVIDDKRTWDDFIEDSPHGQLFHKWEALKIIEKHTGYRLLRYAVYKGNSIIGVFPIFFRSINGIKTVFSPPPNTCAPYMGFAMCADYEQLKQKRKEHYLTWVVDEVDQEIRKLAPNYVSFCLPPGFLDSRPFKWNHYLTEINYTFVIDLRRSLDDLMASFDATCKKNIKRVDKLHLSVEQATDPRTFCEILDHRYNEQGLRMPMASYLYLKDLMDAYPDNVRLFFLYQDGKIAGLNGNLQYKDKVMLWLGSANMHLDIAANDYLVWEFIRKAHEQGYRELEIQGAGEKRLSDFKSKFNPRLELCQYIYKKDNLGRIAEVAYANIIRKKWV